MIDAIRCKILSQRLQKLLLKLQFVATEAGVTMTYVKATDTSITDKAESVSILSDRAVYHVTLPKCDIVVTVTARCGFDVTSSSGAGGPRSTRSKVPLFQDMPVAMAKNPHCSSGVNKEGDDGNNLINLLYHPVSARFDTIAHLEAFFRSVMKI
jgi:hypothetical protein